MRRLLMLAFDFPPIASIAVERALRFVRNLPSHGWSTDVVTIRPSRFFLQDSAAMDAIPAQTLVWRTRFVKALMPVSLIAQALPREWRMPFKRFFAFPDFYIGWWPFLLFTGRRLLSTGSHQPPYDVLFSTSPPFSAHVAAYWLKRAYGIPWVADFRDPWLDNPLLRPPTVLHRTFHARLERCVVQTADAIIENTELNRERMLRRYPSIADKLHVIPNGFDDEEYPASSQRRSDDRMTMSHAGTLFPQYEPGPLLIALSRAIKQSPEMRAHLRLKLFGSSSERRMITRLGLSGVVEEYGWRSRRSVLEELQVSDVLILCMSGPNEQDFWVPGKTYTYLPIGKPVLALVPPGEARQIVQRAGLGIVCGPNDVDEIEDTIAKLYRAWKSSTLAMTPDWDFIRQFEGKRLTERLSRVLNLIAGDP